MLQFLLCVIAVHCRLELFNSLKIIKWGITKLNKIMQIWLYKNCDVVKQILAHSPIYVMNDDGKTIEKI